MNPPPNGVVVLRDVSLAYDREPAVHHLSGSLQRGSLTAIVGPNGAGKSTLIKAIAGMLRPARGVIERPRIGRRGIGYLPQHAEIDRGFPISVMDTVLLGHWPQIGWARATSRQARDTAQRALAAVGLDAYGRQPVGTLSAGQLQRVLFARLIVQDAELILLDEPFSAVDWRTAEDLLRLIVGWHREGRTIAAVLHDLDQVREHFPTTLLIARECIAWGATPKVLTPYNLERARHLSAGWGAAAASPRPVPKLTAVTPSA